MYVFRPFPSLVEAVLEKRRQEEVERAKQPQMTVEVLPAQVLPLLPRAPIRPRKIKPKEDNKMYCSGCGKKVPWELHLKDCPILKEWQARFTKKPTK